ncbi:MAG: endonuclease domain-containing protein [Anaerolineaceae bacterium]|nr:endonuclease domain-containing protein [Anaerolineaceae bacterium]MDD4042490.1 endonuclease domain-containing protein [Anaerolineaceae bacterium]MDD4578157.1 endonuclease domain-containing protein [Anaerolineaceae bacterium]
MSPHPLRDRSRELRKNATKQEKSLWYSYLRNFELRVHRQSVIGKFIVDFYCHQAKLVIEIDGGQHYSDEEMKSDQVRTTYLESQGLKVLRFTNWEVEHQLYQVCEQIKQVADQRLVELGKE